MNSIDQEINELLKMAKPWLWGNGMGGTDKFNRHGYAPMYVEILKPFRGREMALLEIGVRTGASLCVWQQYLGPAAVIKGVDVNLSGIIYKGLDVVRADATNASFAETLADNSMDVIIDDGSHKPWDQWTSFSLLCGKLKPGGCYIIEDISKRERFKELSQGTDFRFYNTRRGHRQDDYCAVFFKRPTLAQGL
jgi:SAM-dependent methyltransferase